MNSDDFFVGLYERKIFMGNRKTVIYCGGFYDAKNEEMLRERS